MKKGSYRVGIIKFMDHTSLNRIEAGTVAGLDRLSEKYGVPIDYEGLVYDGKADMETMRRAGEELAEITLEKPLEPGQYQAMIEIKKYDASGAYVYGQRQPVTIIVAGE